MREVVVLIVEKKMVCVYTKVRYRASSREK